MQRPLKVTVQTLGRKSQAIKQTVVETDPSVPVEMAVPDKVLSEGEKRAVALADFLTEVALDDTSAGIILDDPVTSLDFEWKEIIAGRLVAEAKRRQVVVFTHDLHFLYCLKKCAEQQDVDLVTHWIQRRDDKPGWVFLDNSPALERDYRRATKARRCYEEARSPSRSAEEQEGILKEGFGALRTNYEAFVIFDLFCEVVMRFEERISIGRLKGVVLEDAIVDQVIAKSELISRYIEGHLHSDTFAAQKPTPRALLDEIEAFEGLQRSHKELLKKKPT